MALDTRDDALESVGGKGRSLARMTNSGVRVPGGFIVRTRCGSVCCPSFQFRAPSGSILGQLGCVVVYFASLFRDLTVPSNFLWSSAYKAFVAENGA